MTTNTPISPTLYNAIHKIADQVAQTTAPCVIYRNKKFEVIERPQPWTPEQQQQQDEAERQLMSLALATSRIIANSLGCTPGELWQLGQDIETITYKIPQLSHLPGIGDRVQQIYNTVIHHPDNLNKIFGPHADVVRNWLFQEGPDFQYIYQNITQPNQLIELGQLFSLPGLNAIRIEAMQQLIDRGAEARTVWSWLFHPDKNLPSPADLEHIASPDRLTAIGNLLFPYAIEHNRVDVVKWLLDRGAGVDARCGTSRHTLLHLVLLRLKNVSSEMAQCILQHPTLQNLYAVRNARNVTPIGMMYVLPRSLNREQSPGCFFPPFTAFELRALIDQGQSVSAYLQLPEAERKVLLRNLLTRWPDIEFDCNPSRPTLQFLIEGQSHSLLHVETKAPFTFVVRQLPQSLDSSQVQDNLLSMRQFASEVLSLSAGWSTSALSPELWRATIGRPLCQVIAAYHRAIHEVSPPLTESDWRGFLEALLPPDPTSHEFETRRRMLYVDLAHIVRTPENAASPYASDWNDILPVVTLPIVGLVPHVLLQQLFGWDDATTALQCTLQADHGLSIPIESTIAALPSSIEDLPEDTDIVAALVAYVERNAPLPANLLVGLFIAADLLLAPQLQQTVIDRCRELLQGPDAVKTFRTIVLPILKVNTSVGLTADLVPLLEVCLRSPAIRTIALEACCQLNLTQADTLKQLIQAEESLYPIERLVGPLEAQFEKFSAIEQENPRFLSDDPEYQELAAINEELVELLRDGIGSRGAIVQHIRQFLQEGTFIEPYSELPRILSLCLQANAAFAPIDFSSLLPPLPPLPNPT